MKTMVVTGFLVLATTLLGSAQNASLKQALPKSVRSYLETRSSEFAQISPERRQALDEVVAYVRQARQAGQTPKLLFICTHNSRRSQIGQVMGMVASWYYGWEGIEFFSGGTEATAFHPNAAEALRRVGLPLRKSAEVGRNTPWSLDFSDKLPSLLLFSKKYSDEPNPRSGFAALMVCTEADGACPVVAGAAARISMPYVDPKAHDSEADFGRHYDETVRLISREMLYVFSRVGR